jgi:hypothetical protein
MSEHVVPGPQPVRDLIERHHVGLPR